MALPIYLQFILRLKQNPFLLGTFVFRASLGSRPFLTIIYRCSVSYSSSSVETSDGVISLILASFSDYFVKKHAAKLIMTPMKE